MFHSPHPPPVGFVSRPVKTPRRCMCTPGVSIFCTFLQRSRRKAPSSIFAAVSCINTRRETSVEHKHMDRRCNDSDAAITAPPTACPEVGDIRPRGRLACWPRFLPEGAKRNGNKAKYKMFSSCHTLLDCERRHTAELHTSSQARGLYILNNICLSFSSLSFTLSSAEGDKQANMHGDHKPLSWSLDRLPHMLTKITVYQDCVLFCLAAHGLVLAALSQMWFTSPGPTETWILGVLAYERSPAGTSAAAQLPRRSQRYPGNKSASQTFVAGFLTIYQLKDGDSRTSKSR